MNRGGIAFSYICVSPEFQVLINQVRFESIVVFARKRRLRLMFMESARGPELSVSHRLAKRTLNGHPYWSYYKTNSDERIE